MCTSVYMYIIYDIVHKTNRFNNYWYKYNWVNFLALCQLWLHAFIYSIIISAMHLQVMACSVRQHSGCVVACLARMLWKNGKKTPSYYIIFRYFNTTYLTHKTTRHVKMRQAHTRTRNPPTAPMITRPNKGTAYGEYSVRHREWGVICKRERERERERVNRMWTE